MRALLVAVLCSSAMLGRAALADPAQPESSAVPSAPAQAGYSASSAAPVQAQAVAPAAAAPATAAPAAPTSASTEADLNQVVCKQTPPTTGTRFGGGRECHTARQWRDRQIESERILQQQQRVGFSGSGS